ncbi:MAG: hypothetical protein J5764_05215 [Bacteroidales bacterium]|nr:hypothetical protein [Bacteroidales bacterium]
MVLNNLWKEFLIGVLGTAIGVGLSFFVNGIHENKAKEKAQRLTAIMVIHDMDNTIDILKKLKKNEEEGIAVTQFVQSRQSCLETVSYDSLILAVNYLISQDDDFRFDVSKEKIFNSDLDTWQNLSNTKFIDNVQSFFFQRQEMQAVLNKPDIFREPIPREEYLQIVRPLGWVTQEQYADAIRPFLKKKFADARVSFFINVSNDRIRILNEFINNWTTLNDENKFLMGITDSELDDYINSISNVGITLSRRRLLGKWKCTMEDDNSLEYDFHGDNSFDYRMNYSTLSHGLYFSGTLKFSVSYGGSWALQGDSLILYPNYELSEFDLDTSGLVADENKQDSLDVWAKNYQEKALEFYRTRPENEQRIAGKARLDSSHDKMEWSSPDGIVRYLKRIR